MKPSERLSADSEIHRQLSRIEEKKAKASLLLVELNRLSEIRRREFLAHPPEGWTPLQARLWLGRNDFFTVVTREWIDRIVKWYKVQFMSLREQLNIGTIGAHGTGLANLFSPSNRRIGTGDKGILFDGLINGEYGAFDLINESGGQGGWWSKCDCPDNTYDRTAWILIGRETQKKLVVIPSIKAYINLLDMLAERLRGGEVIAEEFLDIIHVGEFAKLLFDNNGLLVNSK